MGAPEFIAPTTTGGGTPVGGSGTPGTIPVWSGTGTTLTNSPLVVSGTNAVGFGTPKTWGTNFTTQAMQISDSASLSADINTTYLSANWYLDATYTARRIKANFAGQYRINGATGDHSWLTAPSGAADSALTLTTAMTLTQAGYVGIGAPSPGAQLQVERAGGTSNAEYLRLRNTSSGTGSAVGIDQYVSANTVATGRIQHAWNGTTYDTIFSNWNGSALAEAARTVGGTTPVLSVPSGLKLPATPGNADTQTLDCYQEVTNWVPTVTFGTGGTVSYTVHTGHYVRVGRLVTFALRVDFTVTAAPTGGDLQITLPVASAVDQYFGSGNFNSLPGSGTQGPLYVSVGVSSTANIRKASATGGSSIASAITASSTFIVTGTYIS